MSMSTVLSGIRATGRLHLGNYLGAIRHWVELSRLGEHECFFFIADFHTLTTKTNPREIQRDREDIVLDLLAAGINMERASIYCQASVPEITTLSWLLSCLTPVADLERMHHWKEKKQRLEQEGRNANAGLLTYPVLMAADILGPKGELVPVGDDQRAHVEFARELARYFNREYGNTFPEPRELVSEAARVPSLAAGGKMGKSEAEQGTVFLGDDLSVTSKKLRQAVTDPNRKQRQDPGDPSKCGIYTLHTILSTPEQIAWAHTGCTTAGIGCVDCKGELEKNLAAILRPFQERRAELALKRSEYVREILAECGRKVRTRFQQTLAEVEQKMGIPPY